MQEQTSNFVELNWCDWLSDWQIFGQKRDSAEPDYFGWSVLQGEQVRRMSQEMAEQS
jgi:hypothetical protein